MKKKTKKTPRKTNVNKIEYNYIVLVVLAYVIGFTTAFIAFGIDGQQKSSSVTKMAEAEKYEREIVANIPEKTQASTIKTVLRNEDLYVMHGNKERVISAHSEDVSLEPGFHWKVFSTKISPSKEFIYFCTQLDKDRDQCRSFVYSLNADTVFSVTINGDVVYSTQAEADAATWNDDDTLNLKGTPSYEGDAPWVDYTVDSMPKSI